MQHLTTRERELVALGAGLASNCVPCIEAHIPAARQAGLSEAEIEEAVHLADQVRQVPAAKVLETALAFVDKKINVESQSCSSAMKPATACCGA